MRYVLMCGVLGVWMMGLAAAPAAEPTVAELTAQLQSGDAGARIAAADLLAAQAEKAAAAVPALAAALKDPSADLRAHAAHALGQIGAAARAAAPALVPLVADSDLTVRRKAAGALRLIRPGPQVSVPLFVKLIGDADPGVRMRAMQALSEAGEDAVPFLIAALDDEHNAYWACLVLHEIGAGAKYAAPALVKLLESPRPEVRREAMLALGGIGPDAAAAVPKLVAALDDPATRTAATFALARIGKLPPEAEAKIRANRSDADKVLAAASILATALPKRADVEELRQATVELAEILKDPNPNARKAAARALVALRPGPAIGQPILEKAFQDADEKMIEAALDAVAALGEKAVPALTNALRMEKLRPRVAYVLGELGPAAAPATEALVGLIGDKNPEAQREALMALAKIGPAAKAAVPALIKALQSDEASVAHGAAYALGRIGPDAIAAKMALFQAIDGKDESLALIAAWALVHVHPQCAECAGKAVPVLVRGLSDSEAQYRLEAAKVLGTLGALAKPAVAALKKAQSDADPAVRDAAAQALQAIGN